MSARNRPSRRVKTSTPGRMCTRLALFSTSCWSVSHLSNCERLRSMNSCAGCVRTILLSPAPKFVRRTQRRPRSWPAYRMRKFARPLTELVTRCAPRDDGGVRVVARVLHTQRRENILAHELFIAAARDLLDQVPQQHISRIAIAPFLARREIQRFVAEARHFFRGRGRERLPFRVLGKTGETRDPRRMGQQVINGDLVPRRRSIGRAEQLKRLDGVATILATTAVQDAGLLALLAEGSGVSEAARSLKREMLRDFGIEPAREELAPTETATASAGSERRIVPQPVISRQLANPFLAPDFSAVPQSTSRPRRLAGWELLGPLLSSFERAGGGAPACMALPAPTERFTPAGLELMPHQGHLVAAAAAGHRTFLLADEPGLGKTAQALLAAEAANAYPLLVVVPNVVKTNWAREAARWAPHRPATVVQGNGEAVDGFADIVVLNYEVLDRHMGWLGDFGFRGMVVDEAHFMKNKTSQRSQNVLAL